MIRDLIACLKLARSEWRRRRWIARHRRELTQNGFPF